MRRKVQKRSHTLRYTLKNRATDNVLFVVLFTLYLKEDVDEHGRVKDGVEGGKPFELLSEAEREKQIRAKGGDVNGEKRSVGMEDWKEPENEKLPDTNEDDVD